MHEREGLLAAIAALEKQRESLGDAVVSASIAALQKQLRDLDAQGKLSNQQRKWLTVLFADIVSSTHLTHGLDPEDFSQIIDGSLKRMAEGVNRNGGRVTRFMGDGFLAVFGAPQAHEDDAERAVNAGLGILETARQLSSELADRWGISNFQVRVGVNTGLVVLGGETEAENTLLGMPVNLAARLESAAPSGGLLISQDTYRHVRGLFEVQALEPISAKGFPEPVPVFLVLRAMPPAFRQHTRGVEGVETRMVGREAELKRLQDAFTAVLEDHECQVITITGEAGIGKSRLLFEFEKWLEKSPLEFNVFRGRSRPEMQDALFALLRELFVNRFNILGSDSPGQVWKKIEAGVAEILAEDLQAEMKAHFIGQLLGFDFNQSSHLQGVLGDARQFSDRALRYLREYFARTMAAHPTLVLLEDIHWADNPSLDFFSELASKNPNEPLLLVCLARPVLYERRPHWGEGQPYQTRLALSSLTRRECRGLVEQILQKMGNIPASLRERVVASAEGNPFFVEELIKKLIDDQVIITEEGRWRFAASRLEDLHIPPTLVSLLQARLDSLPALERSVLQAAAVVGVTFWDHLVKALYLGGDRAALESELDQALLVLREKEMIFQREKSAFGDSREFIFKHTSMRDVAYESISRRVRQTYHAIAAEWLIEHSRERAGEFADLIADHLELAGQKEKAAGFLRQAGELAARSYANPLALKAFNRAQELAPVDHLEEHYAILLGREAVYSLLGARQRQREDLQALETLAEALDDDHRRSQVALRQAVYASQTSDYPAVIARAEEVIQLEGADAGSPLAPQAHQLWGRALLSQGDFPGARQEFEKALEGARAFGLAVEEAASLRNLGIVAGHLGDPKAARDYYQRALEIYRRTGDRYGEGQALNNLGNILLIQGDQAGGRACYESFLEICRELGDRWGEGLVVYTIGDLHLHQLDFREAGDYFEQALEITRDTGNRSVEIGAMVGLANIYLEHAEYANARYHFEASLNMARKIGNRPLEARTLAQIGRYFHQLGDYVRARNYFEQALSSYTAIGKLSGQCQLLAEMSLLSNHLGDYDGSRELSQQAIEIATHLDNPLCRAAALLQLGHAYAGLGEIGLAWQAYQDGLALVRETGPVPVALEYRAAQARLSLSQGEEGHAQVLVGEILEALVGAKIPGDDWASVLPEALRRLTGASEPIRLLLTCYQVLETQDRPRARSLLGGLAQLLHNQAAKIEDVELRHAFLNNVATNREILSASKSLPGPSLNRPS
jgi:class 3 adenylate cyclase/tetratricopeptide (TPR) repeat protein